MLTSTGNIRRPPISGDAILFGTPDEHGPFLGRLREFDHSGPEASASLEASQRMLERIDAIVGGASRLAIHQTLEADLDPADRN